MPCAARLLRVIRSYITVSSLRRRGALSSAQRWATTLWRWWTHLPVATYTASRAQEGDRYETIGKIPTRGGAGTSYWSPELNRYYVAAPANDTEDAAILMYAPVD